MKKNLKWLVLILILIISIILIGMSIIYYKVKYGFPIYEKTAPELNIDISKLNILIYSKTNGFSHTESILEANKLFNHFGKKNDWNITFSNNGAIFNDEHLNLFNLIIWNNVTGRTLNKDQRKSFKKYMENGGSFIGLHGAGDDSHHWPWYYENLINAEFSHHSIDPHIQGTSLNRECSNDLIYCKEIPERWIHSDEWYVFYSKPTENGAKVLYSIDDNSISTNGNMGFLIKNKNFGMGENHPVIWHKCIENGGKSFYSSLGHSSEAYQDINYKKILEFAITWSIDKNQLCN
tara:strand:+ start:367 stop:1242 length:876 start_codon:yes stop_codon:yes gene_type:complete